MGRAMHAAVVSDRLSDLTVYTRTFAVTNAGLARLAVVPNVRAVQPGSGYSGQISVGARRAFVWVRGVPAFSRQTVDVVHLRSGSPPKPGEVLVDSRDGPHGLLHAHAGDSVDVIGVDGGTQSLYVSGSAQNLDGGQQVVANNVIVLYANLRTVATLSGGPGYDTFYFQLDDSRPGAVDTTLAALSRTFHAIPGFRGFSALPDVRAAGEWPGKSSYTKLAKFFYLITI